MKPFALLLISITALSFARAEDQTAPFRPVADAIEEFAADYLLKVGEPGPFSIALLQRDTDLGHHSKDVPIPEELEKRLLKRIQKRSVDYIRADKLQIPQMNEKDPADPSGKSYRYIKDAAGRDVYLLRVREIQFISETTIHIFWHCTSNSSGTGHGGTVAATKTAKGWELTQVASWDS